MKRNSPWTDLTGRVFGHLTVLGRAVSNKSTKSAWRCQCDCGLPERIVAQSSLVSGNTKSCGGCARGAQDEKHGRTGTPEHRKWGAMVQRCTNPNSDAWPDYGGRGITICERWKKSFIAFMEDMGPRGSPDLEIERKNNEGNYEPGNCTWGTREEQARNTRRTRRAEYRGQTLCGAELAELAPDPRILSTHVCKRLREGWSVEDAVETPLGIRFKLTDEDAQTIYDQAASGEPVSGIAREYGLTEVNVYAILRGTIWKGINRSKPIVGRMTPTIAQEIFDRRSVGETVKELSVRFGLSGPGVYKLVQGRTWPEINRAANRQTLIWHGLPIPAPGVPRYRPNRICNLLQCQ